MIMQQIARQVCDGQLLKWLFASGLAWLEHNQAHVNAMNVFPVPDGDTGTNMRLTMQAAYDAIAHLEDDHHAGFISTRFARGALLGARGNSGVILSQLLQGFAQSVRDRGEIDVQAFALGCQSAVKAAYEAVINPVEGTMLTVAREAAAALADYAATGTDLCAALDRLIDAAREALARTPDLLPDLKAAGVLDSGGQGLLYILEGMSRSVNGLPVSSSDPAAAVTTDRSRLYGPADEEAGYGYDVQFLMIGRDMDVDRIRADLDAMGWSTLVVGDSDLIKVHIHVHDPGQPISYGIQHSHALDDVVVENMQRQVDHLNAEMDGHRPLTVQRVPGVAVIAVASGQGLERLFYESQAAHVISGGQTMNPSTEDFVQAIEAIDNEAVVLLPNNKNIVLAARQAAEICGRSVRVIPTTTVPQGISAMLAYLDEAESGDLDRIAQAMDEAVSLVVSGEVTTATRDAELGGLSVRAGQVIGLLDGELVAAASTADTVVVDLLRQARAADHELVTLYFGADVLHADADALAASLSQQFPDHRFQVIDGGQPLYDYLLSLE